jgi:hypothetical protein
VTPKSVPNLNGSGRNVGKNHAEWSEDVFEQNGLFFCDEELDQAKAALLKIFLEMHSSRSDGS